VTQPALASFALACVLALGFAPGCIRGQKGSEIPTQEQWAAWQVLGPLLSDAQHQVDETTFAAMLESAELLVEDKAADARERLQLAAGGGAPHWIAVAEADLAVMHFSRCIRGVAWRIENGPLKTREMDFSPETQLGPTDLSVEAMLTRLDDAVGQAEKTNSKTLLKHARIARARVAAYTSQCAPNEDVSRQANAVMRGDLATLAAEGHLTPDLAYLWAAIQYEGYSRQAARPFLLQAQSGGYADPSVDLLLAQIALDGGNFIEAKTRAGAALDAYTEIEQVGGQAQSLVMRGDSHLRLEDLPAAKKDYDRAIELDPGNTEARLGRTRITLAEEGSSQALAQMREQILALIGGQLAGDDAEERPEGLAAAASRLEGLIIAINEDLEMASLCRAALLHEVDLDEAPLRRGLRYYFAATLDVALGDYAAGQGHAAAAELEFESAGVATPDGVTLLLERLAGLTG
jgi:tetratricopeptide (TPR) repeat protein